MAGGTALTNFAVLVAITDAGLQASAKADGSDILFTAADGLSKLNHEIQQYTGDSSKPGERAVAFGGHQYGHLHVLRNPAAASQQNPGGVWDAGYKGVWHLPSATTSERQRFDDQRESRDGGQQSGAGGGGVGRRRLVLRGRQPDDPVNATVGISGNTINAKRGIRPNAQSAQALFGWGNEGGQFAGMWYNFRGTGVFSVEYGNTQPAFTTNNVSAGVWHYVVLTKTVGAVNTTTKIYIDGVDQGAMSSSSASTTVSIADGRMQIGRWGTPITAAPRSTKCAYPIPPGRRAGSQRNTTTRMRPGIFSPWARRRATKTAETAGRHIEEKLWTCI